MRQTGVLFIVLLCTATVAAAPVVTIEQALQSTRQNNIKWKSLAEVLEQADAGRDLGIGLLLPKLQAQGQWIHMGERHVPDLSGMNAGTAQLVEVLGTLTQVVVEEHPSRLADFAPYLQQSADEGGGDDNVFEDFIPPADTLSATFSLLVPVFNPSAISNLQGAYDRYDAAVQQIGYGREQLLYGVCKAYYGLATVQGLIGAADRSVDAARANFETKRVKASLQAATQLEVKRAELELAQAEARRVDLQADLARAKSTFRYLTGLEGQFEVVAPAVPESPVRTAEGWIRLAQTQRKDLTAARISIQASEHEVTGGLLGYLPTVDLIGQAKLDNAEAQRFDDDPFSWNVIGTLTWTLYDGGISHASGTIKQSSLRQAQLAVEDLERSIVNQITAAEQSLRDAIVARQLAERAVGVAKEAAKLTEAAEAAGAVTSLEVIDVNNAVFQAEAGLLAAQLQESMARLDLLAAAGQAVPFGASGDVE